MHTLTIYLGRLEPIIFENCYCAFEKNQPIMLKIIMYETDCFIRVY